jgi:secreted Zn-dependent insulinase-like peptidase
MFYLCQLNASRQEQAAIAGIIPHLQAFIRRNHPLKQFAYPILFKLAKTSKRTQAELRKYHGIEFYVELLRDPYWGNHALEVLAKWYVSHSTACAAHLAIFLTHAPPVAARVCLSALTAVHACIASVCAL